MIEKHPPVLIGTTEECLRHYGHTVLTAPRSRKALVARKPLMDFVGVTDPDSTRDWLLYQKPMPRGEYLIKTRYFLEAMGYEVLELTALRPTVYRLGCLIAYNKIRIEDAMEELGIRQRSHLLKYVIDPGEPPNAERLSAMERLFERFESGAVVPTPPAQTAKSCSTQNGILDHELVIATLAHLVNAAIPLAQLVASNKFTSDERRELRETAGFERVFRLSNAMNQLCSEKAREIFIAKSGKPPKTNGG